MKLDLPIRCQPKLLVLAKATRGSCLLGGSGKRDRENWLILEISSRTVEKHVGRILNKLRVRTAPLLRPEMALPLGQKLKNSFLASAALDDGSALKISERCRRAKKADPSPLPKLLKYSVSL